MLKSLFSQSALDQFSRSFRSIFSLHSHDSRFWPSRATIHGDQASPGSSVAHIAQAEVVTTVESHAMRDVERSEVMKPQKGEIRLHNTLHQEESLV